MSTQNQNLTAEVVSVFPNKVKIKVDKLEDFKIADEKLKVGSYLRIIEENDNTVLIAIIESFSIEVSDKGDKKYIIEAMPLGILKNGEFIRGGDDIAIPPKKVEPAKSEEISQIYQQALKENEKFDFSSLSSNKNIRVPVNGNRFFNKHIAIVGSTGSGKSHTVTKIIQNAVSAKNGTYSDLNNSHIVIFDIHSEYKSAFPNANIIGIDDLVLPYWLLNSDELEDILLDTGDRDNYNQSSIFRNLVTENKRLHNKTVPKIFYDSPLFFDINQIMNALINLKTETKNAKSDNKYMIKDSTYSLLPEGKTNETHGIELNNEEKTLKYFEKIYDFHTTKRESITKGDFADGTLDKFSTRFQSKINQDRLKFLFGENSKTITFENTVKQFVGYKNSDKSNVTIVDLSGIPFEVLSITVSLISRLLFEYGYYYKRLRFKNNAHEKVNNDTPLLLVYEEAHKYAPKSDLARYRPSKTAIERIAKEGRKYGVTLLLASQRPSEISETIFSQCNNFIAMRLTNPDDQSYVKRLLPDTLSGLIDKLPSLQAGEGLLIGEAIILPSIVKIDTCDLPPSSNDILYFDLWKEKWIDLDFSKIKDEWYK
jgi:uncharacterized protein